MFSISSRDTKAFYRDDIHPQKIKDKMKNLIDKVNYLISAFASFEKQEIEIDEKVFGAISDALLKANMELGLAKQTMDKYAEALLVEKQDEYVSGLESPEVDDEVKNIGQ